MACLGGVLLEVEKKETCQLDAPFVARRIKDRSAVRRVVVNTVRANMVVIIEVWYCLGRRENAQSRENVHKDNELQAVRQTCTRLR